MKLYKSAHLLIYSKTTTMFEQFSMKTTFDASENTTFDRYEWQEEWQN